MIKFSNDVDILKYEPALFGELYLPWQVLISAGGTSLSGTTLTASEVDFVSAGVSAGCVVYLQSSDGEIDGAYEVVSVDSATEMTISVLRSDSSSAALAPPSGSDINFRISTFEPQAGEAAYRLTEHFGIRPGNPDSDFDAEDILETEVLKRASVFAVISAVYAMLGSNIEDKNFWAKSQHYRQLFERAKQRCRVSIDIGGDGVADVTRSGGSLRLTRD